MLNKEGLCSARVYIDDFTRENIVVKADDLNLQYRFGMPGPVIKEAEWQQILTVLSSIKKTGFIVASGSLCAGVPDNFFAQAGRIAKQKNAKFIVDTAGLPLLAALQQQVYMIKPNLAELSVLSGMPALKKDSAIFAAKKIIAKKQAEVIVVSMGPAGALLITSTMEKYFPAPLVKIKSTVGAGDSMVAGIVWAMCENMPLTEAVQYGIACGTAATMNEGTTLCYKKDADELFKIIRSNNEPCYRS